jgi:hypothetical protein
VDIRVQQQQEVLRAPLHLSGEILSGAVTMAFTQPPAGTR